MDERYRELSFEDYRRAVREFTNEVLIPSEREVDRAGRIPDEISRAMRRVGLFGVSIPRRFGGLGWTLEQQVLLVLEYTRTLAAYRSHMSTSTGLMAQMLLERGSSGMKERILPDLAAGRITGAAAITESEAGSDAGAARTRADVCDEHYVVNGSKRFSTNASIADVIAVLVRTDPGSTDHSGTSMLLIPRETAGLSVRESPVEDMLSWRGSPTCEIDLNDVRVPRSARIGEEGDGLRVAFKGFSHARVTIAATAVGLASRMLQEAVTHARSRHQFGQPIGHFQLVQGLLADMYADVVAGRSMVLDVARAFDAAGRPPVTDIAATKLFCAGMVQRVGSKALQVLGGDGIVDRHIVSILYRDARVISVGEGPSQVLQAKVGADLVRSPELLAV
ncbi:acyl-CoA dehydrogenase family protein [Saccharopolyspora shandongensis]|uniref:acyl-CoA dehydrogenase family protein n=1 Tax=Saccharopolyspora shandongensis TaxID=418495 RepID=UPI00343E916A